MRIRGSKLQFRVAAVTALSLALAFSVQAAGLIPRGQSIEFSEPKSYAIATNLNALTGKTENDKEQQQRLFQGLPALSKGSMSGASAPIIRPAAPRVVISKRAQELLDDRQNWMFKSPDDLSSGPTAEDIMGIKKDSPENLEMKKLSTMESFFLSANRPGSQGQSAGDSFFGPAKPEKRDEAASRDDLPDGFRASEEQLRKLIGKDTSSQSGSFRSSFVGSFSSGGNSLTPVQASSTRFDAVAKYRELLALPSPLTGDPLNASGATTGSSPSAGSPGAVLGMDGIAGMARHDIFAGSSLSAPLPPTAGLLDTTSKGLMPPSVSGPTLPKPEPAKVTPPTPNFVFPKRAFY